MIRDHGTIDVGDVALHGGVQLAQKGLHLLRGSLNFDQNLPGGFVADEAGEVGVV